MLLTHCFISVGLNMPTSSELWSIKPGIIMLLTHCFISVNIWIKWAFLVFLINICCHLYGNVNRFCVVFIFWLFLHQALFSWSLWSHYVDDNISFQHNAYLCFMQSCTPLLFWDDWCICPKGMHLQVHFA